MSAAIASAFASSHRMGHRVHCFAANMGFSSHMAFPPGLADINMLKISIAQAAYRGPAFLADHTHLAARQYYCRPVALPGHQPGGSAGTSDQLATLTDGHLDVMNLNTNRYAAQRHRIANLGLNTLAALDEIAYLYTCRR